MEWRYFGPVILAILMFLLVGSICERRIENALQRFIELRQARVASSLQPDRQDVACTAMPPQPSQSAPALSNRSTLQRTLRACKTDTFLFDDDKRQEITVLPIMTE